MPDLLAFKLPAAARAPQRSDALDRARKELALPHLPCSGTQEDVLRHLLALPFPIFARTVARLLQRLGYEEVVLRGVTGGRGRNSYGGLDIEAALRGGLTRSRVICQLRHYDKEPVARASVDVLRGAMLRLGAMQGLLVTTSTFAPSAIEAAQAAQHLAPVRLMDGQELARLVRAHVDSWESVVATAAPARTVNVPSPASRLRPLLPAESERHQKFLEGLGAPPDKQASVSQPAAPELDNVTLALHIDVCLAPALPGGKSTHRRDSIGEDGEERRRV